MSAAKDEAEDGPDLSSEDSEREKKKADNKEAGPSHDDGLKLSRLAGLNGIEELNGVTPSNESNGDLSQDACSLEGENLSSVSASRSPQLRPSTPDGSISIPDDTPSAQGSIASSSPGRGGHVSSYGHSPTPSLRPFDRRFHARASPSPFSSPRPSSPVFPSLHSRQSSAAFTFRDVAEGERQEAPWEVVRWTRLRKMTGQAFSEIGKRNFGRPTCIAIAASIVLGTSKGIILVFDYNQNLKSIIGPGTKAVESGPITAIAISADHSTIAAGHATGNIFTWELAKPAKPFLHVSPVDRARSPNNDGHIPEAAVLHLGFLGMRHTALASADDQGMAFSHLATRGMGVVARSVKTTRILGRYPDKVTDAARQRKPSSVLSFSTLPFGNAEHTADSMGLVALLTPYLLVIVSTTPVAQTQYKAPRPKEITAHGAMSAGLAWFPSVKLKKRDPATHETSSRVKLAYCWSNVLTILELIELKSAAKDDMDEPPTLQFRPRSRWKSEEAVVGIQWLSRSVLAILTITQQLIILEDPSMTVTDSSDLIQKHVYHADLFSPQLNRLVDQLEDEEVSEMHGVVADAFYMSFRAYKGRLFLLGYNEISFGTLSNWADRLLALMEEGSYLGAIQLATSYYSGEANKVAVGLPEDDDLRHSLVEEKLIEMISASLKYVFGEDKETGKARIDREQIVELSSACITACNSMKDNDFLFDEVYDYYQNASLENIFIESLEPYIINDEITILPPLVVKDLVSHYAERGFKVRLEEMICHLEPQTMDIDQITTLCKKHHLYDALLYVWSQALGDHTTIVGELLDLARRRCNPQTDIDLGQAELDVANALKVFPYLSYQLTGRVYPTGKVETDDTITLAKAEIYHYFFRGSSRDSIPKEAGDTRSARTETSGNFSNLRKILDFDAPSFLSMLNEAFEDNFLDEPQDRTVDEIPYRLTEEQKSGLSINRQLIVTILLEVMGSSKYGPDDTIYLDMFIARNTPKFPQSILLSGHVLHRVLVGLCQYPGEEVAEDCQLSTEYLLSVYKPPDLASLLPLISKARFYRVLKSIYKAERQYGELVQTCFEDHNDPDAIFECLAYCLIPGSGLSEKQINDVRQVILDNAHDLIGADIKKAASTIDEYAHDLHGVLLDTVSEDRSAQFEYLQTILERPTEITDKESFQVKNRRFLEQYVRLLCEFDPSYVSGFVERLDTSDLRLDEVLPALESSHVVDAAVVLMARAGKVREGIDRLVQHLRSLQSILLGLLEYTRDSSDIANTVDTRRNLVKSIQRFARIGVWICQRHTKTLERNSPNHLRIKNAKKLNESLSQDEELWLDLIDTVVEVTKSVTQLLEQQERRAEDGNDDDLQRTSTPSPQEPPQMITELRTVVQETFTALLAATSAPHTKDAHRTDASFLRILRAFLSRVSLSSPSLSNLRAVLGAIFSAYSYEESLLSLANRLLDKDLFVHVTEADALRRRGWRPLGQLCEGCGRKVWGPGAGGYIWDAWQRKNEERDSTMHDRKGSSTSRSSSREGKGKAVTRSEDLPTTTEQDTQSANETTNGQGPVVVFSCRHMFHRTCLEDMQDHEASDLKIGNSEQTGAHLCCPLCM